MQNDFSEKLKKERRKNQEEIESQKNKYQEEIESL